MSVYWRLFTWWRNFRCAHGWHNSRCVLITDDGTVLCCSWCSKPRLS